MAILCWAAKNSLRGTSSMIKIVPRMLFIPALQDYSARERRFGKTSQQLAANAVSN